MLKQWALGAALLACGSVALAHDGGHRGGGFKHADTNADGSVSREEFVAAHEQRFARMDKNSDGVIDAADADEQTAEGKRRHRRGKGFQALLAADSDGKISKQEFAQRAAPLFDQADKDGNGVLSREEMDAVKAQRREAAKNRAEQKQ